MGVVTPSEGTARDMVGEVMPEQFEWERLVREYPIPAMVFAALGGFVLARTRGTAVLAALGTFAGAKVSEEIDRVIGEDVLGG